MPALIQTVSTPRQLSHESHNFLKELQDANIKMSTNSLEQLNSQTFKRMSILHSILYTKQSRLITSLLSDSFVFQVISLKTKTFSFVCLER